MSHFKAQGRPAVCSLNGDVGQRTRGEDELVQATEEGAHEGVRLGDIDLSAVVEVELGSGTGIELIHV